MQAGLPPELRPVHDRISADRGAGRARRSAEDPARERHRVAVASGMVAPGAAPWSGSRDRVMDAAAIPAALRLGRSRDARPMSSCRFAIFSSPRSANTWLRRLLVEFLALEERAIHVPRELDWSRVPERCVLQLHWPPVPELTRLLDEHDFRVCVLVRHPLDT